MFPGSPDVLFSIMTPSFGRWPVADGPHFCHCAPNGALIYLALCLWIGNFVFLWLLGSKETRDVRFASTRPGCSMGQMRKTPGQAASFRHQCEGCKTQHNPRAFSRAELDRNKPVCIGSYQASYKLRNITW